MFLLTSVVVTVVVVVVVTVVCVPVVVMPAAQHPCGGEVHGKPDHRHHQRRSEVDIPGVDEAMERFDHYRQRHHGEQQGAGERSQHLDLPGTEREALVGLPAAREKVCESRDREPENYLGGF